MDVKGCDVVNKENTNTLVVPASLEWSELQREHEMASHIFVPSLIDSTG